MPAPLPIQHHAVGKPQLGLLIATAITLYGIAAKRAERRRAEFTADGAERGRLADRPTAIPTPGWRDILLRVWQGISSKNLSILSAGVAFYALLSLFPALAALVSIYGLVADPQTVRQQIEGVSGMLPKEASDLLSQQLQSLLANPSSHLSIGLIVGIVLALWSARAGTLALIEALNIAYGEPEKRSLIRLQATALALTLGGVLFSIVALIVVAVMPAIIAFLPLGSFEIWVVSLIRWPLMAVLVIVALAIIYRYAPSRDNPQWRWVSWGAVIATLLWLAGSSLFSLYVSTFGSYDKTYGSLGAVVILLLWFYVSAFSVLLGAEINAEMEHQTAVDTTTGRPEPMGRRQAYVADTLGAKP